LYYKDYVYCNDVRGAEKVAEVEEGAAAQAKREGTAVVVVTSVCVHGFVVIRGNLDEEHATGTAAAD